MLVILERVFCFQLLTRFYLIWKIRTWNGFACHEKKRKFNWIGVTGFLGNIWWAYFNFCSLFNNMFILRLCITVGILFSLTNTQGTVYFVSFCKLLWNYHYRLYYFVMSQTRYTRKYVPTTQHFILTSTNIGPHKLNLFLNIYLLTPFLIR